MKKIAILRQKMSDPQIVAISLAAIRKRRTDFWERTKVDTTAFLIFGVATGFVTILYEMVIVGVAFHQWLEVRILYTFMRFLGVYLLGKITDKLRKNLTIKKFNKNKLLSFINKWFADSISLSAYQIPVYILAARICGLSWEIILFASLLYIGDNFLFGWFFGYILDRTRAYFAKKEEVKI